MKKISLLFCFFFFILLPLLSFGQKKAALVSFTVQGLPEQVWQQMTPQAIDSLHDSLVRQLAQVHGLGSITPLTSEKIRFTTKGNPPISKRLKKFPAGSDFSLFFQVQAEVQNQTVFAGLKLPIVKVKMAVFDRSGKRVYMAESLGKDGLAHAKVRSGKKADSAGDWLDQPRFKKLYLRAVSSIRTGALSARL